jgi:hypothetical protein
MDLLDQSVIQHIEEHGWHVMYVHETDGLPGWSYSIGLYDSFRHPEIIILNPARAVVGPRHLLDLAM